MNSSEYKTSIRHCARCNGVHEDVPLIRFVGAAPLPYTHYAMCPATQQPVLVKVVLSENKEIKRLAVPGHPDLVCIATYEPDGFEDNGMLIDPCWRGELLHTKRDELLRDEWGDTFIFGSIEIDDLIDTAVELLGCYFDDDYQYIAD